MPKLVAVATIEEYTALADDSSLVAVLGDHTHRIRRLTSARPDGAQLSPRLFEGRVVLALGEAGALAGRHHAAHSGARLVHWDGLDSFKASVLGEEVSSITVVGLADHFGPAGIRTLQRELTAPWGVLTGRDLSALSWVVAKQQLYRGNHWSRHLSLSTLVETTGPAGRAGPLTSLQNEQITPAVLHRLRSVPYDFLALSGHGDQADIYLHSGWLCSRDTATAPGLLAATRGAGVMRCCAEETCYRARIHEPETGLAAEQNVLVPAAETMASVLLLNSCHTLLTAPGYRYRPESAVLARCLEGMAGAVVATELQRRAEPAEALLMSALLWSGHSAGVATWALNRLQSDCFTASPVFVLFGDPDLTIAGQEPGTAVTGSPVRLPSSSSHVSRAPLTDADDVVRAEPTGPHRAGRRAFVVPVPQGREVVLASDRGPVTADPEVRLVRTVEPRIGTRELRLLQGRLGALTTLQVPLPDGAVTRLSQAMASAVRAVRLPVQHPRAVTAPREAIAALADTLQMTQGAAVQRLVREWSEALGGPMMGVDEERVVHTGLEPTEEPCPTCLSPLFLATVQDVYVPGVERRLWLCPSCTVVADLPAGADRLAVSAPAQVERGRPFEVTVRLPDAPVGMPGVTTVGAALLGARGRCRPGMTIGAGTLRLYVHEDAVPGTYNLRVVVLTDLDCLFHLQPVSVLT